MKRIILMRHGNAESSYQANDFDRNLTQYGIKEVKNNVEKLNSFKIIPDKIVVSEAVRTQQTFAIYEDLTKFKGKVVNDKGLYDFHSTSEFISKYIENTDDTINTIMFIGHNPTLSNLLQMFTGELGIYLDTASIFVIDFDINNWQNLEVRTGKLYFSTN